MNTYNFAVLRYIHDAATSEFVNVGVVLWAPDSGNAWLQVNDRYSRLSNFYSDFDGSSYRQLVRHLESQFYASCERLRQPSLFDKSPNTLESFLKEFVRPDESCFQWSHVMAGITKDFEARTAELFGEFVTCNEPRPREGQKDEKAIWSSVWSKAQNIGLVEKVRQHVEISSGDYDYEFQMGWTNGKLQVLEPVSFDLLQARSIVDKATSWIGRLSELSGKEDFAMTAVIAAPSDDEKLERAFRSGLAILRRSPNIREVVKEEEVDGFLEEVMKEASG